MIDERFIERCYYAPECENEGDWDEMESCPECRAAERAGMADARASYISREVRELDAEGLRDDPRTLAYWEGKADRADILRKTERGE